MHSISAHNKNQHRLFTNLATLSFSIVIAIVITADVKSANAEQITTDSAPRTNSYNVDFNSTTQSNEQQPFSSINDDDDFKALIYPGGAALLIEPRRFMTLQKATVDEQIAELNANAIAYLECRKKPNKTVVSKKSSLRIYMTDLSAMKKDGYECSPKNQ